jgi:hypothetical protein
LPKGKAIFPFLGVLDDHPTMAQCEGFFCHRPPWSAPTLW